MATALRPIGHEDRLSIVDHLDELRTRLIICGVALVVAFGFCFWQNQRLLDALNRALPDTPATSQNHISGLTGDSVNERKGLEKIAAGAAALARSADQSQADRAANALVAQGATEAAKALPSSTGKRLPITIGVGEPFTTTLTVAAYFALLTATLSRFLLSRNEIPRGTSSMEDAVIEMNTTGACCPWNLSTVPARTPVSPAASRCAPARAARVRSQCRRTSPETAAVWRCAKSCC